ncbi:MAG: tetratricopeptide repeat protein [Crocinitomix sp.]|nr:tetratricopeptide repeat protein [Crocinitomix sp.]
MQKLLFLHIPLRLVVLCSFLCLVANNSVQAQNDDIDSLKKTISETTNPAELASLLHQLVWEMSYYNPQESVEPAQRALNLSLDLGDSSLIATSYNRIGLVHDYAGNFDLAEKNYKRAYDIQLTFEGEDATDGLLNNLASVYYYTGRYEESMDFYLKSLTIRESKRDPSIPKSLKNIAQSYNNIALLLKRQKNYSGAISYYQKSLTIKKELEDIGSLIVTHSNLGALYMEQDSLVKAEKEFEQALFLTDSIGDFVSKAMILNNIGLLKNKSPNSSAAEQFFLESMSLYQQIGDFYGKATAQFNLANLYLDQGDYGQAEQAALEVLKISDEIKVPEVNMSALHLLSQINSKTNPKKSLAYLSAYITLKDSINDVAIANKINQQAVMYETEKKENAIALLKKDQQISEAENKQKDLVISKNQNYQLFLIIGIGLVAITGLFFVLYYRSRKEAAEQRAEKLHVQHQRELDNLRNSLLRPENNETSERIELGISQDQLNLYLLNPLSDREIEVLYLIAEGKKNKDIADQLFISVNTVKTHVLHIYEKLDVKNRTEAAAKANSMKILK